MNEAGFREFCFRGDAGGMGSPGSLSARIPGLMRYHIIQESRFGMDQGFG